MPLALPGLFAGEALAAGRLLTAWHERQRGLRLKFLAPLKVRWGLQLHGTSITARSLDHGPLRASTCLCSRPMQASADRLMAARRLAAADTREGYEEALRLVRAAGVNCYMYADGADDVTTVAQRQVSFCLLCCWFCLLCCWLRLSSAHPRPALPGSPRVSQLQGNVGTEVCTFSIVLNNIAVRDEDEPQKDQAFDRLRRGGRLRSCLWVSTEACMPL